MVEIKQKRDVAKTRSDLLQKLMEEIVAVMKQMHNRSTLPQELAISPPQARLLFVIANGKEGGISVKDLAEKTSVTPGAITQFVDVLVKKGLVQRYEDLHDRRIVRLTLTNTAKEQFDVLRKNFLLSATRAFNVLTDEEIRQLINLLSKVNSNPLQPA